MKKILTILFLLLSTTAYAVSKLEHTVCYSGCDFTTLSGAVEHIEDNHANLVALDSYADIKITGEWLAITPDTVSVVLDGITTDSTHYINIYADETARHNGTILSGYMLAPTAGNTGIKIDTNSTYVTIDSVIVKYTVKEWQQGSACISTGSRITKATIKNNILFQSAPGSNHLNNYGIYMVDGSGGTAYIYNNIIYDFRKNYASGYNYGINLQDNSGTFYIYNNTIYNCDIGFKVGNGTFTLKNNIGNGNSIDYSGTIDYSSNNISEDATSPDNEFDSIAVTFNDEVNKNFHLGVTETNAVGNGTQILIDPSTELFSTDIDGDVRGSTWDIGADQLNTTSYIPSVSAFVVPSIHRLDYIVPITTFTATSILPISGYLITETASTPAVDNPNWSITAPSTYTCSNIGVNTLYAWVKDSVGTISSSANDSVDIKSYGSTIEVWANSGEDKVRQDEIRKLDNDDVTNYEWDGTNIILKEAKNAFASFSIYIEAGGSLFTGVNLTDISVEVSDLDGPTPITTEARDADNTLFDFTGRNIELFYAKYLKVVGLPEGNSASVRPEDRWAYQMQRPSTEIWVSSTIYPEDSPSGYYKTMANSGTLWEDRPGADKYFSEILIPLELEPTFDIVAGQNQQIWCDIFIPKTTTAGDYTGTVTIKDDGVTIKTIPIQLEVYNFTLPDKPSLTTWTFFQYESLWSRIFGVTYPHEGYSSRTAEAKATLINEWKNVQFMLKRHGLAYTDNTFIDDSNVTTVSDNDFRNWEDLLDGSLFTTANGYDGPGIETPPGIAIITPYGFAGEYQWNVTGTDEEKKANICGHADDWYVKLHSLDPDMKMMLFMVDEPRTTASLATFNTYAGWVDECTGGGQNLATYITTPIHSLYQFARNVDIGLDSPYVLDGWQHYGTSSTKFSGSDDNGWILDAGGTSATGINFQGWDYFKNLWTGGLKERQTYNNTRQDIFEGFMIYGWKNFVDDISTNFIWESNLWGNNEGGQMKWAENTNVFKQASTIGGRWSSTDGGSFNPRFTGTGTDDFSIVNNWQTEDNYDSAKSYIFKIDSVTPDTFTWSNDGGSTWEDSGVAITEDTKIAIGYGTTDFSPKWTHNHTHALNDQWDFTVPADDSEYGQTTTGNGWGVFFYPATEKTYTEDSYNLEGIFAGIKVKLYRKTVQDYEYLTMANLTNSSAVSSILSSVGVINSHDCPVDFSDVNYATFIAHGFEQFAEELGTIDEFQAAREQLANIITGYGNGNVHTFEYNSFISDMDNKGLLKSLTTSF